MFVDNGHIKQLVAKKQLRFDQSLINLELSKTSQKVERVLSFRGLIGMVKKPHQENAGVKVPILCVGGLCELDWLIRVTT